MRFLKHNQNKPHALGILFFTSLLGFYSKARAYSEATHELLTAAAINRSVIKTDANFMSKLGLNSLSVQQLFTFKDAMPVENDLRIVEQVIRYGASYEDGLAFKIFPHVAFNHFFDLQYSPPTGRGLTMAGAEPGAASPDWILETRGKAFTTQYYSYKKAHQNLYRALTNTLPRDRLTFFSITFQSLGHISHHIQDMAQPQHVRNEPHLDIIYKFKEVAFEEFSEGAIVEPYISELVSSKNYPIPSTSSNPAFKKAIDFWYSASPTYSGMA